MTLLLHELRVNKLSLIIWSAALSFMLAVCIIIYPEMSSQMSEMNDMFSDMGAFSDAFGMNEINFGEFGGYFVVECGNVLGLGGAIFAAIMGASALYKEENNKTAEFLLTQPISRRRIVTEKLISVVSFIMIMNISVMAVTFLSVLAIGEKISYGTFMLVFLAYIIMQLEIVFITFGISAFVKSGALAIGIGVAFISYFVNILSNLTESAKILKFITPFGYTDGSGILKNNSLEWKYLIPAVLISALCIYLAYRKYDKKDILT